MKGLRVLKSWMLVWSFWIGSPPLLVDGAEKPQKDVPRFEKEVRAIAIQVFVTDKDGRAVSGLTDKDFRVTDEKKDRPISFYTYPSFFQQCRHSQNRHAPIEYVHRGIA